MGLQELLGSHVGEAAAVATAVCWSLTPLFFTSASRRVGSFPVNMIRLVLATFLLGAAVLVTSSAHAAPWRQVGLLFASGVVGLSLGDAALFRAFVLLGARRVSLLGALAPVFVAVLAVPMLGEHVSAVGLAGMAVTLAGVAWVVMERSPGGDSPSDLRTGIVLGALAALGQAVGLLLAKAGLGAAQEGSVLASLAAAPGSAPESVTPLLGTLFRMLAATVSLGAWAAAVGRLRTAVPALRDRRAMSMTAGGAFFGPFVGVWLSLVAVKYTTETAVAQTIMAFSPVLVIVFARFFHGERPTWRAWAGSLVAVGGVAILAFRRELGG